MKILCEMNIQEIFHFSTGHTAFVGLLVPNIDTYITSTHKADLLVNDKKIKSINIIGEDIFSGGNKRKQGQKRSIRTDTDISKIQREDNMKLIIYY